MKGFCFRLCCFFFIMCSLKTFAGITVYPNIINFTAADLPRSDVTVINNDDEEAYIKITPHIILHPGSLNQNKVKIHNPEKYGLLVTPQQLIIPPKQQRLVRLMLTRPLNEHEFIYGIDIVPIAREIVPTQLLKRQGKNMGLQLLVGYGVLTIVRPVQPQLNIKLSRQGKILSLSNEGNTNVEISKIEQCFNKTCHLIKNFMRLYAGNSQQIPLNLAKPVTLVAQLLDEQKILTSD